MNEPNAVSALAVERITQWIDDVVVRHNFCPFARATRVKSADRLVTVPGNLAAILALMDEEISQLDQNDNLDTSLIIVTDGLFDFDDYLDVLYIAETHLTERQADDDYQIASFHPSYRFDGNTAEDLENYTNRAPYPVLQLLKETSVTRELNRERAQSRDPEAIPAHNIARLQSLSDDSIDEIKTLSAPPAAN